MDGHGTLPHQTMVSVDIPPKKEGICSWWSGVFSRVPGCVADLLRKKPGEFRACGVLDLFGCQVKSLCFFPTFAWSDAGGRLTARLGLFGGRNPRRAPSWCFPDGACFRMLPLRINVMVFDSNILQVVEMTYFHQINETNPSICALHSTSWWVLPHDVRDCPCWRPEFIQTAVESIDSKVVSKCLTLPEKQGDPVWFSCSCGWAIVSYWLLVFVGTDMFRKPSLTGR